MYTRRTALVVVAVLALLAVSLTLVTAQGNEKGMARHEQSQNVESRSPKANHMMTFESGKQPTREIHVATTGSDIPGCGSLESPCASVSFVANVNAELEPGTAVRIHEGIYTGRQWIQSQSGTAEQPIWIGGAPGESRPIFTNAEEGLHATEIEYVILHDLEVHGTESNGINVDDCLLYDNEEDVEQEICRADETRTHHLVFRNLYVHDIGSKLGNYDCLKLSGVNDFWVYDSEFNDCGMGGGSGIDQVGCHHGTIKGNSFTGNTDRGINAKGGSQDIEIVGNYVETRWSGIDIGGRTEARWFRPPLAEDSPNFEARNIRVIANVIKGSEEPLRFQMSVDSLAANNTIVLPDDWLFSVLQDPDPSTDGYEIRATGDNSVFNNIFYFYRGVLRDEIKVNDGTAIETFTFANNLWFALDDPTLSKPELPSAETDGIYGLDPLFVDLGARNYRLKMGSPAFGSGRELASATTDFAGLPYKSPPSIGAFELYAADEGSITIEKDVVGQLPSEDWQFDFNGQAFALPADGSNNEVFSDLGAGFYPIMETATDDYIESVSCSSGENGTDSVTVDLQPGEHVTCTFTNTYDACELPENPTGSAGETTYYSTCRRESEPNDSFDTADSIGPVFSWWQDAGDDAISGEISDWDDVDYYILDPAEAQNILLDIDAQSAGSALDAVMCLYDHNRNRIGCSDDADGLDPMLFTANKYQAGLDVNRSPYYIMITPFYPEHDEYPSTGTYTLSVADPKLASPQGGGQIGSVAYSGADILARTSIPGPPIQEKWILFFDASDVGVSRNTVAFDTLFNYGSSPALALTFAGKQTVTDATGVKWKTTRHDVVRFDAMQLGPRTMGTFAPELILDGSKVGLTTSGERIDAITYESGGGLLVSTTGSASVPGSSGNIQARDEDLLVRYWFGDEPSWYVEFDGSSEVPGLQREDVHALSYESHPYWLEDFFPNHWLELVIRGSGRLDGNSVTQQDEYVFWLTKNEYGLQYLGFTYPFEVDALD